ncbi:MAG TPA: hypothetical protein DCS07_12395 [Bdellovibrionales bacterium]|nr:MAG: hypothetical protein A2X97_02240 [Bdellovibrionales bacterium GWA1_52_35]HAR43409.1 hypothetical protein [Bdellovibrionales bacterium]HCM39239.1 hypothetical protein [Bdellovibrionales bacterium]
MKQNIVRTIRKILDENEITLTELAKASNLPTSKLSRLLSEKQEMTLTELELICKTINISTFDLVARAHGENILPNQTAAPDIDKKICTDPLLFDLVEILQIPHDKSELARRLRISEKTIQKALNDLVRLGVVFEDIHGNYQVNKSPFYDSVEFYNMMSTKFDLISQKTFEMGHVKEYWKNKSNIILHAYLDEEQLQNIKNMYRVILRLVENFQISNRSSATKRSEKTLTSLVLINHPYECHKHE